MKNVCGSPRCGARICDASFVDFCGEKGWNVKRLKYKVKLFNVVGVLASSVINVFFKFKSIVQPHTEIRDVLFPFNGSTLDGNVLAGELVCCILLVNVMAYVLFGSMWSFHL